MDDKEIKRMLKDASLYLNDAAKAWPKYPEVAWRRINAASALLDIVKPAMYYDKRPLGGEGT